LVTHDYIVVETSALVQRGLGWEPLRRFIDDVVPALEVEYAGETLLSSALTALRAARSVTTSLVDQVSFEFMRRHSLEDCFAFDPDFTRAGFRTVPS
jgi:predicted nucleic acid-binding protein